MAPTDPVCDLVVGRLAGWNGLPLFDLGHAPPCLGTPEREGWLELGRGPTAYQVVRTLAGGVEVWLFQADGEPVCLVEAYSPPTAGPVAALLGSLGEPDLKYPYPLAARLQRMLAESGEELEERVYGARGLAVAVARRPGVGDHRVFRLRGFRPSPAEAYYAAFVDLPELRFLEE